MNKYLGLFGIDKHEALIELTHITVEWVEHNFLVSLTSYTAWG